ncbi:hypothetical protein BHW_0010600, partial (plasmid) [Borrelia hermsii MTW]
MYEKNINNFIIGNSPKSLKINVLGQFEKIAS